MANVPMNYSFDSIPDDDALLKSAFHHVLVAFAAPGHWPTPLVFLAGGVLAMAAAAIWFLRGATAVDATLVFLIQTSFFIADIALLASLPRRRISFGPWPSQIFALALPRTVAAAAIGLFFPWLGWWVAFVINLGVQLAGVLALYRGAVVEPSRLSVSELTISSDRLAPGTSPLRILHISDLHIERLGDREARLLELARAAAPDIIVITGDYVNLSFNIDPLTHAHVRRLLGQLVAPGGVFAVLGSPAVDVVEITPLFEGLPVRLLRNEAVIHSGSQGQPVTILGLDCTHRIDRDRAALDRLTASLPEHGPRILLHHSPDMMPAAVEHGIDLYVCGHTHGGQVRLPLIGPILTSSKLGRRYVMGRYHEGRTHLYVSRGVGFEGLGAPRVRFFCPPEIVLTTIEPA